MLMWFGTRHVTTFRKDPKIQPMISEGHQQYHHGRNIIHYIHAVHHFLDVTVESTTAEK